MKTRVILILAVLVVGGACCLAGDPAKSPVAINDECILIPGNEISKDDQNQIKAILEKYNKVLYKIQRYENGTVKGSLGQLEVRKEIAADVAKYAKKDGLTSWTTQIGVCERYHSKSCSSGGPTCLEFRDSDQLVPEVAKILKKYK